MWSRVPGKLRWRCTPICLTLSATFTCVARHLFVDTLFDDLRHSGVPAAQIFKQEM
jgi:hypothetical protein